MAKFKTFALVLSLLVFSIPAFAQNPGVVQQGIVTAGHGVTWAGNGKIQDGGALPVGSINSLSATSPNSTLSIGGDASPCAGPSCTFTFQLPNVVTGATVGSATVTPVLTFDNFGRVTNISSATTAPPFSAITGQASCAQLPAFTGDTTKPSASCAQTTVKVNGVSYAASPSTDTVPVITAANTATYTALPNCTTGALNYSTATHLFSCAAAGSGTVTQISQGLGIVLSPSPITTTGSVSLRQATIQNITTTGSGTLTTAATSKFALVRWCGAGGGGTGSGTGATMGNGGNGGDTTFNSIVAGGGGGGTNVGGGTAGTGGVVTGSPDISWPGLKGMGSQTGVAGSLLLAVPGGNSPLWGGAVGGQNPAAPNTGAGGSSGNAVGAVNTGASGGSGACAEMIVPGGGAGYSYTIGAGGVFGAAGTSGLSGQNGSAGRIISIEF